MNKKLLYVLGGCAVLLLVCCIGVGVLWYVVDLPGQITRVFGDTISQLEPTTVAPFPPAKITPLAPGTIPTQVAPPKASSSGSNPFADALGKAKSASKYRSQFAMIIGGTTSGKYAEETLFDMTGEVDGKNTRFSSKGGFLALLSGDVNGTVEFLTADNKTYMRGVKMFGDAKIWYVTSNNTSSGMEDYAKPDSFNKYVDNPANFKKVGTELVDGQACDIWSGALVGFDATSMLGIFGAGKDAGDIGVVDKSETRISLCADGYVHKFSTEFQGHNAKTPTEKGAFKMNGHMWDFNNITIKVTPPTDAKPFPGG